MDYHDFIDEVEELDFINDRDDAEAAVKAVLGTMVSHIEENLARRIASRLPEPLTFQKLRGHHPRVAPISADQFISEISANFNLDRDEARNVIDAVLHVAKAILGDEEFETIREKMPGDWADFLVNV
jgi:uncharacterized protein (DUF2267 family)